MSKFRRPEALELTWLCERRALGHGVEASHIFYHRRSIVKMLKMMLQMLPIQAAVPRPRYLSSLPHLSSTDREAAGIRPTKQRKWQSNLVLGTAAAALTFATLARVIRQAFSADTRIATMVLAVSLHERPNTILIFEAEVRQSIVLIADICTFEAASALSHCYGV